MSAPIIVWTPSVTQLKCSICGVVKTFSGLLNDREMIQAQRDHKAWHQGRGGR